MIALVVRTRRPFFRSRPGTLLLVSTAVMIVLAFAIPYLPFAAVFGFVRLPTTLLVAIATIAALYVVATELLKKWVLSQGWRKPGSDNGNQGSSGLTVEATDVASKPRGLRRGQRRLVRMQEQRSSTM